MATATLSAPSQAIAAPALSKKREFYRCHDCLTVVTTDVELKPVEIEVRNHSHVWKFATCGACGGDMEYLGRTHGALVVRTELHCACDGRCTNALGPSCDCQCGGENHGTGRMVEVVVESGKLPVMRVAENAARIAEEFRKFKDQVRAAWEEKYGELARRRRTGEFLTGPLFARLMQGERIWDNYRKASSMKSHKGRLKALGKVLEAVHKY